MRDDDATRTGPEREEGVVKWFDPVRRFGFIGRDGEADLFVHASSLEEGGPGSGEGRGAAGEGDAPLRRGERVSFEVAEGARGLQARAVRRLGRLDPGP